MMRFSKSHIQVAANMAGWGHWTRILAIALHQPHVQFDVYNTVIPNLPLPKWIPNVKRVTALQTGIPLVCEHGYESLSPYSAGDFSQILCVRKASRTQPDEIDYHEIITVSDLDFLGDFPPVILQTPVINKNFPNRVLVCNEASNLEYLKGLHPDYTHKLVHPITSMRGRIEHLVGIGSYNLFWKCVYYEIPCKLYPSIWPNDSIWRMKQLGERPMPKQFANGALAVGKQVCSWWQQFS